MGKRADLHLFVYLACVTFCLCSLSLGVRMLQDRLSRVYFHVSAHLNFILMLRSIHIFRLECHLGPCKARHQDLCTKSIEYLLFAIFLSIKRTDEFREIILICNIVNFQ